jgi:hypothetical protein
MNKILELKWQVLAALVLVGGLLMSRGGVASLMPFARVLVPVIVVLVVLRLVKKRMAGAMAALIKKQMEAAGMAAGGPRGAATGGGGKVIDLCPQCGTYLAPGHRCKR